MGNLKNLRGLIKFLENIKNSQNFKGRRRPAPTPPPLNASLVGFIISTDRYAYAITEIHLKEEMHQWQTQHTNKRLEMERKQHFVLIHGSCHGAWCWYKVVNLLKTAGHQVTALDLGASGVDPKRLEEVTSFSDYLQPLMDFFASLPDEQDRKVILVGHSYAGLCISLAMERFPKKISVAVFVAAYMPHHSSPLGTLIQEVPILPYYLVIANLTVYDQYSLVIFLLFC